MVRRAIDARPAGGVLSVVHSTSTPSFAGYAVARRGWPIRRSSGQFAADYRNKAAHSVPCPVIEQRKAAADLAAPGNSTGIGAYNGRTPQKMRQEMAALTKPRNQFIAQPQQLSTSSRESGQSFRAGHANRRCAQECITGPAGTRMSASLTCGSD